MCGRSSLFLIAPMGKKRGLWAMAKVPMHGWQVSSRPLRCIQLFSILFSPLRVLVSRPRGSVLNLSFSSSRHTTMKNASRPTPAACPTATRPRIPTLTCRCGRPSPTTSSWNHRTRSRPATDTAGASSASACRSVGSSSISNYVSGGDDRPMETPRRRRG